MGERKWTAQLNEVGMVQISHPGRLQELESIAKAVGVVLTLPHCEGYGSESGIDRAIGDSLLEQKSWKRLARSVWGLVLQGAFGLFVAMTA